MRTTIYISEMDGRNSGCGTRDRAEAAAPKDRSGQLGRKAHALQSALTSAYLRSLRAAEMAEWELTGGDYLLSTVTTRN